MVGDGKRRRRRPSTQSKPSLREVFAQMMVRWRNNEAYNLEELELWSTHLLEAESSTRRIAPKARDGLRVADQTDRRNRDRGQSLCQERPRAGLGCAGRRVLPSRGAVAIGQRALTPNAADRCERLVKALLCAGLQSLNDSGGTYSDQTSLLSGWAWPPAIQILSWNT